MRNDVIGIFLFLRSTPVIVTYLILNIALGSHLFALDFAFSYHEKLDQNQGALVSVIDNHLVLSKAGFSVQSQESHSAPNSAPIPLDGGPHMVLRTLDKITARIGELRIPIGQTRSFGSLFITARYCRTRSPIETPETFAYLEIKDQAVGVEDQNIFEGWMLASSPALHALEHPVYDIWVIACKTASGDDVTGNENQSVSR